MVLNRYSYVVLLVLQLFLVFLYRLFSVYFVFCV
nr:MAG TPA: hypothetical protein [Caudoviricetes sp.]